MQETFEEIVSRELSGLYNGALFLSAGDGGRAESLLEDALVRAFPDFGAVPPRAGWLDRVLVQEYLEQADARPAKAVPPTDPLPFAGMALAGVTADAFHRAAGLLPPAARVAIWLVVLRRWSYGDAADALGTNRDGVVSLLAWRDALLSVTLAGARRRGSAQVN